MTPEEILTAFKPYAFEQLELFIPATDQATKADRDMAITVTETDLTRTLEHKIEELSAKAGDKVLSENLTHRMYDIMNEVIMEYRYRYSP